MQGQTSTTSQLRLPMQAAPVDRSFSATAIADGSGAEPAGWFDDIVKVATTVGPPLLGALGV